MNCIFILCGLFSSIDQTFSAGKRKSGTRNGMFYNKLLIVFDAVVDAVTLMKTRSALQRAGQARRTTTILGYRHSCTIRVIVHKIIIIAFFFDII